VPDVALWDLVAPYFLLGNAAGNAHVALEVLAVDSYEEASDPTADVLRGRARIHADVNLWFDPTNFSFGIRATNGPGHPNDDPTRRDPWIDLRDTTIDFQLLAPRIPSAIVQSGQAPIDANPPPAFIATDAVLDALDTAPFGAPFAFSDYPSTEFVLDLVVTSAVLRPPFLQPAKLQDDGLLVPDPAFKDVTLTLPKLKLQIRHGSAVGSQPQINILSFGATGLDDPGDPGVAQMVTMDPPYAFIGSGRTVGFGFRSAVLDLSNASTPPAVLAQFGFDEAWTGVYFPEIRLFLAPQGAKGWAVNAGARNLLLGIGASAGVTGDFLLDVINQGDAPRIGARFFGPGGQPIALTRTSLTTAEVVLPPNSTVVADVEGGTPPYASLITIGNAQSTAGEMAVDMTTPVQTIVVSGSASASAISPAKPTPTLTITARLGKAVSPPGGTTTLAGGVPPATVTKTASQHAGVTFATPRLVIASQTATDVTVRLDDGSSAIWTIGTGAPSASPAATATFALVPDEEKDVKAEVAGPTTKAPIYFHYDEPDQNEDAQLAAYALNEELTHTAESKDTTIEHGWSGGVAVTSSPEYAAALRGIPTGTQVVLVGHASWDGDDTKVVPNQLLSERRAKVARNLYDKLAGVNRLKFTLDPRGFSDARTAQQPPANEPRRRWWRVELKTAVPTAGVVTTGTVKRPPIPQQGAPVPVPVVVDPPSKPPGPPPFLHSIGAIVRIVRDEFVAVELHGEVDFDTAAEKRLRDAQGQTGVANPPKFKPVRTPNAGDGIVDFRGVFTRNPGSDEWALDLTFGSDPADVDGLVMAGSLPGQPALERSDGRNVLGLYALLFPLLSAGTPDDPAQDSVADILLTDALLAVPFALALTPWFTVQRIIWYGGEVRVRQHNGAWSTTLFVDIETAVSAEIGFGKSLKLLTIAPETPLVARYKAVGLRFGVKADGSQEFHPVFDSSKGYTLDMSKPGALTVAPPLGNFLRVDGAKIAKTNPTIFEVNFASAVDLGVVSLDRCGVRVTFQDNPKVELTELGVSVDIANVIKGNGYLKLSDTGMAGRLDLALVALRLRIAAELVVAEIPKLDANTGLATGGPATGVAVSIEVEFPVAIPLWSTGLGLYGLLGLFAMHFGRNEAPEEQSQTKALDWLKRAKGDPTTLIVKDPKEPQLWTPRVDHWAFGVGALLGTMGSSVVFNMKGVFMLELPGPRLLLMMKANLLVPMPDQTGDAEGTMLAVVDLDAGRGTLTIGIVIDFTIDPILELEIPIEAFFDSKIPKNWHIFLGRYDKQIRAVIFGVFRGSGYLMLAGDGKQGDGFDPDQQGDGFDPDLPRPSGFVIAAGLSVSMLWGDRSVGLYAELSAGFDAIIGFSPLLVAGIIQARGELKLFIISISASATLEVRLGQLPGEPPSSGYKIHGEVCGSIDLFFFEIEGCVDFTVEGDPPPMAFPPLVDGVTLVNRSPALAHGTGTDDPVDGGLGDAVVSKIDLTIPVVPIDAIPVVMFSAPPMADGVTFAGTALGGASGGREVERSTDKMTYTLASVELIGPGLSSGPTPATWWTLRPPNEANESAQLALLSWVPNATPKALMASEELTQNVEDRWGTVCDKAAPPAQVLWTFRFEPLGPSVPGWSVDGEAWPDPPQTVRSTEPATVLGVDERWRCGDPMVDPFRGILPAEVVGALVACPQASPKGAIALSSPPPIAAAGARMLGPKLPGVIEEPRITQTEMTRRLNAGIPVSGTARSQVIVDRDVASVAGTGATASAIVFRRCSSRILAAPRFDTLAPPVGDPRREQDIAKRWALQKFKPGDLADAVVLRPGRFDRARLLLFVEGRILGKPQLVVRALAADKVVSEVVVGQQHMVTWATLPTTWVDPAGPWDDDVALVMNHLGALSAGQYTAVLIEVKGKLEADTIVVGLRSQVERETARLLAGPPYYVAALESLSAAEVGRADYDSHVATANHAVLEAALGPDSGTVALLAPNELYEVEVKWSAVGSQPSGASEAEGGAPRVQESLPDQTQSFYFFTKDKPPERLDPWVLACQPYEGERNVFPSEPLQLAFATPDVAQLYAAYGYTLEVRLKAASAMHPDPVTLAPEPVAGSVLSPWEETIGAVIDPTCVEVDGARSRHSVQKLAIPLRPSTDYLLDIVRVTSPGADGDLVYRRAFATSAFRTLADYARYCLGSHITHRAVPTGLAAKVAVAFATRAPEGEELDNVLCGRADPPYQGIEPLPVPEQPQIIVWWETVAGSPPQPSAVVIDATEPLWRSRERAKLVTLPKTNVQHWELSREPWIWPEDAAGPAGPVARIVPAPGGQRAIVLLDPGARGKHLQLNLHREAFRQAYLDGIMALNDDEPLADVSLLKAPWEED
jgi:hypothetical protein